MRVLWVEDDPDQAKLNRRQIDVASPNVDLVMALRGDDAAEMLVRDGPWDLVLLDFKLPGSRTGVDLARISREAWPDTPVIVITSMPGVAHATLAPGEEIDVWGKDALLPSRLERALATS